MAMVIGISKRYWIVLGKKSNPRKKRLRKTRNVTKRSTKIGRKRNEKKKKNKLEGWKKNTWVAIKQIRKRLFLQFEQFHCRKHLTISI